MEKEKEINNEDWYWKNREKWGPMNWKAWGSWFSWGSPVGLGLFFIEIGIVAVLFRYAFVVIH